MPRPPRRRRRRRRPLARAGLALAAGAAVLFRGAGGQRVADLAHYFAPGYAPVQAEGYWYEIQAWGARTENCFGTKSMACMACAMNTPDFAAAVGTVPIGVSNDLWFEPERAATCGMCLRVYMPEAGTPEAALSAPAGTKPYFRNVEEPWAYNATIKQDADGAFYFEAVVVEWFDRWQASGDSLTYPAFNLSDPDNVRQGWTDDFGVWKAAWKPVPCSVGTHNMTFFLVDFQEPHPLPIGSDSSWRRSGSSAGVLPSGAAGSLCDNQAAEPCGRLGVDAESLPFIKLKIAGGRYPIGAVALTAADGETQDMRLSGDGFWQASTGDIAVNDTLALNITCLDGDLATTVAWSLVPEDCFCTVGPHHARQGARQGG